MFSRRKPSGLRKQARRARTQSLSRRNKKRLPALSTNEDDDNSNLLVSPGELSAVSTKSGSSNNSGQEVVPGWTLTSDTSTSPLEKKRSFKDLVFTRTRSLTRSLSFTKNKESNIDDHDNTKPTQRRSRSWSRSLSLSGSLKTKDKERAISDDYEGALIFKAEEASEPLSKITPLKKKRSLKDRLAISAPQEPSIIPTDNSESKTPSQSEASPMSPKKKRSFQERLFAKAPSSTKESDFPKTPVQEAISDEHEGPKIFKSDQTSTTLSQGILSKKKDCLRDQLEISEPQQPSISPVVSAEPKPPPQSDVSPLPLKKPRSFQERLVARPLSLIKELDFSLTPAPKSPRTYGRPRITINDGCQQIVDPPPPLSPPPPSSLPSPPRECPSSDGDDEGCRYAIPESYSLQRSPATRGRSGKPKSEHVEEEEEHSGNKSVFSKSWSNLSYSRSELTWIPTEDDRYKIDSVFIFGDEETDNTTIESKSAYTDSTGLTGTTDGDTSMLSTGFTGTTDGDTSMFTESLFTGLTDYSEGTGVTSKISFTGCTGATGKTSATGYTTSSGDTVSSYSDDTSFPSMSTKSQIPAMSIDTSLFDLDVDNGRTSIKERARNPKREQKPKKKNFFMEVISDLLSMAEEMADERGGCKRVFRC